MNKSAFTPPSTPGPAQAMDVTTILASVTAAAESGNLVFPTTAELALKVQRLIDDPDCSIDSLAKLVQADPLLAARVVAGSLEVPDFTCAADQLLGGLTGGAAEVDAGFPMDSAWRAALPPETGFVHVDDVPTEVFTELARQGADLAREHGGPQGPPASLLDSEVLDVHAPGLEVKVPLRCVLALAAMGFMTDGAGPAGDGPTGDGDVVRVRALPAWLRIDARFGSVFRRRGDPLNLLVG